MKILNLILLLALTSASSVFGAKVTMDELASCSSCVYGAGRNSEDTCSKQFDQSKKEWWTCYNKKRASQVNSCIAKCDFSGKDFSGTVSSPRKYDFNGHYSTFYKAANFSNANLSNAEFINSADNSGSVNFSFVNFSGANLKNFKLPYWPGYISFNGANLNGADITGINILSQNFAIKNGKLDLQEDTNGRGLKDTCIYNLKTTQEEIAKFKKLGATDNPNAASCKIGS